MDLIERQAAIDALDVGAKFLRKVLDVTDLVGVERTKYEWGLGLIEACICDVKELPTVQPEPNEGHWIDKGDDGDWAWQIDGRGNSWHVWGCSECGKSVFAKSSYCPHCGAKMKGETT